MLHIQLLGKKEEVAATVQALKENGFTFGEGEVFEVKIHGYKANPYTCFLIDFRPPIVSTSQPRHWDAVLGGKN